MTVKSKSLKLEYWKEVLEVVDIKREEYISKHGDRLGMSTEAKKIIFEEVADRYHICAETVRRRWNDRLAKRGIFSKK